MFYRQRYLVLSIISLSRGRGSPNDLRIAEDWEAFVSKSPCSFSAHTHIQVAPHYSPQLVSSCDWVDVTGKPAGNGAQRRLDA